VIAFTEEPAFMAGLVCMIYRLSKFSEVLKPY
jgi:hypothetical protein